jgi:hypothetical protein
MLQEAYINKTVSNNSSSSNYVVLSGSPIYPLIFWLHILMKPEVILDERYVGSIFDKSSRKWGVGVGMGGRIVVRGCGYH